jgi:hypothetical protein
MQPKSGVTRAFGMRRWTAYFRCRYKEDAQKSAQCSSKSGKKPKKKAINDNNNHNNNNNKLFLQHIAVATMCALCSDILLQKPGDILTDLVAETVTSMHNSMPKFARIVSEFRSRCLPEAAERLRKKKKKKKMTTTMQDGGPLKDSRSTVSVSSMDRRLLQQLRAERYSLKRQRFVLSRRFSWNKCFATSDIYLLRFHFLL